MSNDCWQQLGLSPTADPDRIRASFLAQLEKQEEQQGTLHSTDARALRHAYDEALRQARRLHSQGVELAESSSRELQEEVEDLQTLRERKPFRLFDPAGRASLVTPLEESVVAEPSAEVKAGEEIVEPEFEPVTVTPVAVMEAADTTSVYAAEQVECVAEGALDPHTLTRISVDSERSAVTDKAKGEGAVAAAATNENPHGGSLGHHLIHSTSYEAVQSMMCQLPDHRDELLADPESAIAYLMYLASCYDDLPVNDLNITEPQYWQVQALLRECFQRLREKPGVAPFVKETSPDLYCRRYTCTLRDRFDDPRISLLFLRVFNDRLFVPAQSYTILDLQLLEDVTNDAAMPIGLRAYFAAHLYVLQERYLTEQKIQQLELERRRLQRKRDIEEGNGSMSFSFGTVFTSENKQSQGTVIPTGIERLTPFRMGIFTLFGLLYIPLFWACAVFGNNVLGYVYLFIACFVYQKALWRIRDSILSSRWDYLVTSCVVIFPALLIPLTFIPSDVLPNRHGPSNHYSLSDFDNLRALLKRESER
ncbi:hypothetical protein ACKC9G_17325 [Pokkaliibacter sp. CJK22405]|uniref:hypothetical protein n=1 Tax=Pokkaliibacter sp. CJK22405 TaxID=3384615 RepID=UPI0039852C1E